MRLVKHRCAFCECSIHGTADDPICLSGLYGSAEVELCKECQRREDREVDEKGTNDIPELVKAYSKHKFGY